LAPTLKLVVLTTHKIYVIVEAGQLLTFFNRVFESKQSLTVVQYNAELGLEK